MVLKLSSRFLHPPPSLGEGTGDASREPPSKPHAEHVGDIPPAPPAAPYSHLRHDPRDDAAGDDATTDFERGVSRMAQAANDSVLLARGPSQEQQQHALQEMDRPFRARDHLAADLFRMFTLPAAYEAARNAKPMDVESPPLTAKESERVLKKMM